MCIEHFYCDFIEFSITARTLLTADQILHDDTENALSCSPCRVGAAAIHRTLEFVLNQPLRQPFKIAVTQQTTGVQQTEKFNKSELLTFHLWKTDTVSEAFKSHQPVNHNKAQSVWNVSYSQKREYLENNATKCLISSKSN